MPILHSQFRGEGLNPQGGRVPIHPGVVLASRGPIIQITLGIAEIFAEQLLQAGNPVPEPTPGLALIDTGASNSCIDDETAQRLNLPVVDRVNMASASHDATEMNVYPALISFVGTPLKVNALRSIGAALSNQGIIVLLGRDVLQVLTMFYNGPNGELTISL